MIGRISSRAVYQISGASRFPEKPEERQGVVKPSLTASDQDPFPASPFGEPQKAQIGIGFVLVHWIAPNTVFRKVGEQFRIREGIHVTNDTVLGESRRSVPRPDRSRQRR